MEVGRSYYDPTTILGSDSVDSSACSKKYHSSRDISAVIAASRRPFLNKDLGSAARNWSYLSGLASEASHYVDTVTMFQSSRQSSMRTKPTSFWFQQPFKQLFGVASAEFNRSEASTDQRSNGTKDDFSYTECEAKFLQSLRFCIVKLLQLEVSRWFFRQNGRCDKI
jgi:ethylene-insensitive protein 2